jgi:NAD(P)-dependent dehydrogenase (short-subunit alcohol dehydrogenase family)
MDKWNIDQVPSQSGKVAIVTGANSGIGYETTLGLVKKGMEVIMACRNLQHAEEARLKLLKAHPEAQIKAWKIDLSSLKEVEKFANQFQQHHHTLDLLINNAGIMMSPYQVTEDGFENQLYPSEKGFRIILLLGERDVDLVERLEIKSDSAF